MNSFFPVSSGYLRPVLETYTETGQRQYGAAVSVGLSVVELKAAVAQTSIRTDISGSKSSADERTEAGRVLIHPRTIPKENDLLNLFGDTYEIVGVRKVVNMFGRIDHYQVELSTWASE